MRIEITALALTFAAASATSAATFGFAGYTFDTDGEPTDVTASGNFSSFSLTPTAAFNGSSLGRLFGGGNPSAVALGEPSQGGPYGYLNLTYATPIPIGPGVDFVVFEPGNKEGLGFGAGSGFEPFRFQVFTDVDSSATVTPLVANAGFVDNNGNAVAAGDSSDKNGFFVYEIDVDLLVPGASFVSSIVFQTPTATGAATFSTSKRDPDFAYVGRVVAIPSPAAAMGGLAGLGGLALRRRRRA